MSKFIMTPQAGAEMILSEMGTKLRHYMPHNQERIIDAVKTVMGWNEDSLRQFVDGHDIELWQLGRMVPLLKRH